VKNISPYTVSKYKEQEGLSGTERTQERNKVLVGVGRIWKGSYEEVVPD